MSLVLLATLCSLFANCPRILVAGYGPLPQHRGSLAGLSSHRGLQAETLTFQVLQPFGSLAHCHTVVTVVVSERPHDATQSLTPTASVTPSHGALHRDIMMVTAGRRLTLTDRRRPSPWCWHAPAAP